MGESYYEVLGVAPDASHEEIEGAYRERVLETHPDRNDDPDAADQFKAVSTAADVLTDETERAKYDRLGHEAYCGIESDSGSDRTGSPSSREPRRSDEEWWEQFISDDDPGDPADQSGPSHHARQRARRERRSDARDRYRSGTGTARGTTETAASGSRSTAGARRGEAADGPSSGRYAGGFGPRHPSDTGRRTAGRDTDDDEEFSGFAVHQWDDEVELASPFRRLDTQTLIFACGLALLYPVLVYTTITPHLPLLVNLVIGACTLVLIGYLLTLPRIALASFGGWSLLVTGGLLLDGSIPAVSVVGLGLLAGVWIPFGYAVGVWIALRP